MLRVAFAALALMLVFRRTRAATPGTSCATPSRGLALGFMNLTFYLGLDRLDLGVAVTIEFIGPLGVAVFLSRRRLDLVWAALAAVGIVLLANPGGAESIDTLGLVFVLIAGGCWAAYILIAQRARARIPGQRRRGDGHGRRGAHPDRAWHRRGGRFAARPGAARDGRCGRRAQLGDPLLTGNQALRRIPANVFGVLMSMEPAVAALAGLVVLGQDLGLREIVAIAFVVAASAGVSIATPPEA